MPLASSATRQLGCHQGGHGAPVVHRAHKATEQAPHAATGRSFARRVREFPVKLPKARCYSPRLNTAAWPLASSQTPTRSRQQRQLASDAAWHATAGASGPSPVQVGVAVPVYTGSNWLTRISLLRSRAEGYPNQFARCDAQSAGYGLQAHSDRSWRPEFKAESVRHSVLRCTNAR